jgi:nucleoside-diphosphate-sugar epimerase
MRVLITGGAGFIGSNLVRACLEAGDAVRVLDDFSTGFRENLVGLEGDVDLIEGSLVDFDTVRRATADREVVYHLGALGSVPLSVEDPVGTHAVNATGTLHVLEAARREGLSRIVYAASCSAYGDTQTLPTPETTPARPLSPYALQKLTGEAYCAQFTELHGLETIALRYFNVYGPRQSADSTYAAVVPLFISAILDGKRPTVFGDGRQSRDFTFVSDAVAATRAAAAAPPEVAGEVCNVARGDRITLLELLDEICRAAGVGEVERDHQPPRAGDVRDSQADVSKAERLLGWTPRVDLPEGIAATVEHLAARAAR